MRPYDGPSPNAYCNILPSITQGALYLVTRKLPIYEVLRVERFSALACSIPDAAASATLSLASTAVALTFSAAFLTWGGGVDPLMLMTPTMTARRVTKTAARPPAASGTNLMA